MKFRVKKSVRNMAKAGVLAGSLLGLSLLGQSANGAQGVVSVDVTVPPLIILYYYDDIDINLDATALANAITNGDIDANCDATSSPDFLCSAGTLSFTTADGSAAGSTITYDADIETDSLADGAINSSIDFIVNNAWAVRAISPGGLNAGVAGSTTGEFTSASTTLSNPTASLLLDAGNIGDLRFTAPLTPAVLSDGVLSDQLTITVTQI
ncbi:MAG: hypothetical protein KJN90_11745 [Gammaproteobacteria bacterium]|nr:hypothetical protein [Gammaproteobacteria bacterium]